ncbi:MAG: alpha-amylase [Planctomycetota bacterium]
MYDGVLLQGFHWYLPNDGKHWSWLEEQASSLASKGITAIWLPPASKAWGSNSSVGYDGFDFWDLGRYRAHNNPKRTKHGSMADLQALIGQLHTHGIQAYADLVFNHKMGGEEEQWACVKQVDLNDSNHTIKGWERKKISTGYRFKQRMQEQNTGGTPTDSRFEWNWDHFDAYTEGDGHSRKRYVIKDKDFSCAPMIHHGNQPFLMGAELDTMHPDVVAELDRIGDWLVDTVGFDGFRIDAIKHIRASFFPDYLHRLRQRKSKSLFTVGEYWEDHELGKLTGFLDATDGALSLFDFRLRQRFWEAADAGRDYPLHTIFHDTLTHVWPTKSVTFVDNHDLQPHRDARDFCRVKHDWFKPLAYALILLRPQGYPCIFAGDYFDSDFYRSGVEPRHGWMIDRFLEARKHLVGYPFDRFDHPNCIGWIAQGNANHKAVAVVMSNADDGWKDLPTRTGCGPFTDITQHISDAIHPNDGGETRFTCAGGKVSVWVEQ